MGDKYDQKYKITWYLHFFPIKSYNLTAIY